MENCIYLGYYIQKNNSERLQQKVNPLIASTILYSWWIE